MENSVFDFKLQDVIMRANDAVSGTDSINYKVTSSHFVNEFILKLSVTGIRPVDAKPWRKPRPHKTEMVSNVTEICAKYKITLNNLHRFFIIIALLSSHSSTKYLSLGLLFLLL